MHLRKCTVRAIHRCPHTYRCRRINIFADGHYLNLPVIEADGRLIAIVDVLKLTYATLEQVRCPPLKFRW